MPSTLLSCEPTEPYVAPDPVIEEPLTGTDPFPELPPKLFRSTTLNQPLAYLPAAHNPGLKLPRPESPADP